MFAKVGIKMSNEKKRAQNAPHKGKYHFEAAKVESKKVHSTPEAVYDLASFLMNELKDVIVNPDAYDLRSSEQQFIFQTLYGLGEIKAIFKYRIPTEQRKGLLEPREVRI